MVRDVAARGIPQSAGFAFTTAQQTLGEQLKRVDALDTKAGVLLAADGIIAGIIFSQGSHLAGMPDWIALIAGTAILISLGGALGAFVNRNYEVAPTPETVATLASAPEDWIRWRLIGNVLDALDINRAKLSQKTRFLTVGQIALLVGLSLVGGYFLYATFSGGA